MPQTTQLKTVSEWVGGLVTLPAYITGEGDSPYRPETLFWMLPDGPVLGMTVVKPGEATAASAAAHLRATTKKPMIGKPHRPTRVRVASAAFAKELERELGSDIQVVCAPTPEIDHVAESLRAHMNETGTGEKPTYLTPGMTPDAVASLFRNAARLFRAAPWKIIPDDSSVMSITIPSLGIEGGALSIIGRMGESLGFVLFPDDVAFDMYLEAAEAMQKGNVPSQMPPHFALNFEPGAEMSAEERKEISTHAWEIAGPNAYPWLGAVDEDLVARPPTPKESTIAEAISLGLVALIDQDKKQLRDAWKHGKGFRTTMTVSTHAGPVEITLAAPYDDSDDGAAPERDGAFDFGAVVRDRDGSLDDEWFDSFSDELALRFAASPEGQALAGDIGWIASFMGFGKDYHGVTVAKMTPGMLEEILFEIFPRKVSCEPEESGAIVSELRAFWTFLKREFALRHADACLAVLDDKAAAELEEELSNPENFGMAKSLFMAGKEAGFDMSSKAGMEGWMNAYNGLAELGRAPEVIARTTLSAPDKRAKKNKRKAERAGRRKNR